MDVIMMIERNDVLTIYLTLYKARTMGGEGGGLVQQL